MPTYRLKLRDFETTVTVPKSVKGLRNVANYICMDQAKRYAESITGKKPMLTLRERRRQNAQNWYDSHIDAITDLLTDLRDKLRDKHG